MVAAAVPYFSLDVVNFEDVARAVQVEVAMENVFDDNTWGDTAYALISLEVAIDSVVRADEGGGAFAPLIDALKALPPGTMVNLGGDSNGDFEKAKDHIRLSNPGGVF